jgi:hypothetical protein
VVVPKGNDSQGLGSRRVHIAEQFKLVIGKDDLGDYVAVRPVQTFLCLSQRFLMDSDTRECGCQMLPRWVMDRRQ